MSRKHAKPAAKSVAGYKMKSPRQCTSPTPWHGYNLQAGDIYGVDRVGPYVARPHMYKGQMIFMRPCRGQNESFWVPFRATAETSEHVAQILKQFPMTPPEHATKAYRQALATYRAAKMKALAPRFFAAQMQAGVIRKTHLKFKARQHGNCHEYRLATLLAYGDKVEINGRRVAVTDKIGLYLDGGAF